MTIRAIALSAALVALPFAASAVTAPILDNIEEAGATTITSGSFHSFEYIEGDSTGGARNFLYEFIASGSLTSVTGVSLNPIPLGGITGLFVQWLAEVGATVVAEWDGTAAPFTTGFTAGETKYLSIGWDSSVSGGDVDVNIQAVPVPAGALLLGTALVGAFSLRRKA